MVIRYDEGDLAVTLSTLPLPVWCLTYLYLRIVGYCRLPIFPWYKHLEDTELVLRHGRSIPIPIVKVANEICSKSIGGPLSVYDVAVLLDVEAKSLETLAAVSLPFVTYGMADCLPL